MYCDDALILHKERREALWDERFGDRRVELVFIGMDMDESAVRKVLDAALLTGASRSYVIRVTFKDINVITMMAWTSRSVMQCFDYT